MIIVPVAIFFALSAAGFEPVTVLELCLMAMMPVGNLPLIQSEKMGEDTEILSGAITVTTIMSVFTIPLLMILFTNI